jgi:hypothetical protein
VKNPVENPLGFPAMKLILMELWLFAHGLGGVPTPNVF